MNQAEALKRLHEIVEGIDAEETERDKGWWETSTGAAFGAERLAELEQLITQLTDQPPIGVDYRKASDIPDDVFLAAVKKAARLRNLTTALRWDIACVLGGRPENIGTLRDTEPVPGVPAKVVLAKARQLVKRGLLEGCICGCAGAFRSTQPEDRPWASSTTKK